MNVKVKRTHPGAIIPQYQTEGAAGFDFHAIIEDHDELGGKKDWIEIPARGGRKLIRTGLSFEIPVGYEIQVRPRSGLALKFGITVLNSPGTIDSDYRGEVGIIITNTSDTHLIIKNGERIAQGVVAPVIQAKFENAEELSSTERGDGGFGSTNK